MYTVNQGKGDAFELADKILETWYPSLEEGNTKGLVLLITTAKEGAVTGGPQFIETVGDDLLEAIVTENLPGIYLLLGTKALLPSNLWMFWDFITASLSLLSLVFNNM